MKLMLPLLVGEDDSITHIIAAMTAGATGTIITNPLWVVKTRFMVRIDAIKSDRNLYVSNVNNL